MKENDFTVTPARYNVCIQAINKDLTPMGYLFINFNRDESNNMIAKLLGWIRHPDFKGIGVNKALLEETLMFCKAYLVDKIYCGVLKDKEGIIELLKNYGFLEVESKSDKHRRFCLEMF